MNDLRQDPQYNLYYVNISHLVVTGIFPVTSLVILNYLVYKHLVQRRKQVKSLGKNIKIDALDNRNKLIIKVFVNDTIQMLFYNLGLQTESHHFQLQMKNQLTLENRQVHMLFGVVILFLSGYTLRFVLNLNELHSILIPKNGSNSCPNTLPSWIHVSKTN